MPSFSRYLHQAVSRAVRRSARILADSHSTRTDLVELLGVDEKRITVLYPGVDACFRPIADAEYLGRIRDDYGLPKRFVLGVGTLQPRKNFAGLIDAYGHACRMAPGDTADLDLVIAGAKGWMYDDILAAAAQKDIAGRVRLLGFVPDRDLPALYNLAWVFAFPSLYEGFGLPILEAMACGVPVAAANNSSLPEAAGEGALLVDARDHEALADALLRLCVDTNLRASLVAAGHRQVQRFGWVRAAEQLRDVYSEEAGRRRREGFA